MSVRLSDLLARAVAADGVDAALDAEVAAAFDGVPANGTVASYTSSVDSCLRLIGRSLPGWHWHVGFGALGTIPYASMSKGAVRIEASAPTVPLALLQVLIKAKICESLEGVP